MRFKLSVYCACIAREIQCYLVIYLFIYIYYDRIQHLSGVETNKYKTIIVYESICENVPK